jgi:hypothetical protein
MTTDTALQIVDQLGLIQDQIDQLTEQAENLKAQVKLLGAGTYAGTLYVTKVTAVKEKLSTSWASVAKTFNPSEELIKAHSKVVPAGFSASTTQLSN